MCVYVCVCAALDLLLKHPLWYMYPCGAVIFFFYCIHLSLGIESIWTVFNQLPVRVSQTITERFNYGITLLHNAAKVPIQVM